MRNLLAHLVMFAALAAFLLVGCGPLRSAGDAAKSAIVDCTKHETAKVVGELRPLMGTVIAHAVDSGGKLDYGPVRDFAKGFATDVTRCAVADAVARLLNPPPEAPGAPQLTPLQVDRDAARAGFRELFPGQTFRTESGEI
jgi:hypothetical protein